MRKVVLLSFLSCSLFTFAQTKKVLLEEFTGAHCGICPNGAYYADSMLQMHPDLIAVAIHTYGSYDAMVFPAIDTLGITYAQGAPLGAIDRICPTAPSNNTGVYLSQWDANITTREQMSPQVSISLIPAWNSSTRLITTTVTVNILSNLPTGDYRISLYVVEDSVVGTGSGYDQSNTFDQQVGSQWYGLGDPIVGYVHRHVARALLPGAWGRSGVIHSSPTTGQTFNTTFTYTLPAGYNENRVHLVAFVNEVSASHTTDEVLNAEEATLLGPSGIGEQSILPYQCYFNGENYCVNSMNFSGNYEITDVTGRIISAGTLTQGETEILNTRDHAEGVYILRIFNREEMYTEKLPVQK
jgi:hypothetical protein